MRISHLIVLCVLSPLFCAPGAAQVLHGTVTDRASGEPVPSAAVLVLDPDSSLRAATLTDSGGEFRITPESGRFLLRVERMGYMSVDSRPLDLADGDSLDFAVRLPPEPVRLGSIGVVVESRRFDPSGFYEREEIGWGTFMGPEEIERRRPTSVAELLMHIPGFSFSPAHGSWRVLMTGRGRYCIPTVYLDRAAIVKGTSTPSPFLGKRRPRRGVELDALLNVRQLRAMEVYQLGTDAPIEFHPAGGGGGGGDCGVVVLWTYAGFGA